MKYFIFLDSSSQHLLLGVACIDRDQLMCWQLSHDPESIAMASKHLGSGLKSSQSLTDHILPILNQLFDLIHITIDDIQFVAYGTGPGAFTGVRTSCAIAQGLCFAKSIPAVPVDALKILAQSYGLNLGVLKGVKAFDHHEYFEKFSFSLALIPSIDLPVRSMIAAVDARMQEVYWQGLFFDNGEWQAENPIQVGSTKTITIPKDSSYILVGNAHDVYASEMKPLLEKANSVHTIVPQGYAMASLAALTYQKGQMQMAEQIEPLYVRDKVALTIAQRQAQGILS